MKYSDAFVSLYTMALDVPDARMVGITYKCVAIYLGRIRMAELANVGHGITSAAWIDNFKKTYNNSDKKSLALRHLINLTDDEWKMVEDAMMEYADGAPGTYAWKNKRKEWVRALDTLRAFS